MNDDEYTPKEGTGWGTNKLYSNGRWMRTVQCKCGWNTEQLALGKPCPNERWRPDLAHGPKDEQ